MAVAKPIRRPRLTVSVPLPTGSHAMLAVLINSAPTIRSQSGYGRRSDKTSAAAVMLDVQDSSALRLQC